MRVRAYIRVSRDDLNAENQRPDIESLATRRGWIIDHVYVEHESAAKRRPVFDSILKDAEAHKFDTLIIYALDRFGRSMVGNLDDVRRLDRAGVAIVSHRESWLDTTTGPLRNLLVAIFSYVAEQERANLIERTKAGMARARSEGIKIGRPRASGIKLAEGLRLVESGKSIKGAAREAGVGEGTLRRAIKGQTVPPSGDPS